ncbi:protein FAR-RED IMPAIRED RESPONSE 1 isoform X2 [Benincasa hispida]|uniref:protein FAR-RED IMPAIRED RESPONSE 1 isoform X2 n=1 Tax=Benincasa hispida TaxID=102211 RepID=UPI0019007084|nr:protein FAR-RED IMPAIRED RESPONSE 1 isoform X2 [Benincasa hispida]
MDNNSVQCGKEICTRDGIDGSSHMVGKENTGPIVNIEMPEYMNIAYSQNVLNSKSFKTIEPREGMEFESKENALTFYKEYAKSVGFNVIIKASRRSRISGKFIDAKFACTKYGNKRESGVVEVSDPVTNSNNDIGIHGKKKRGRINRSWEKTDCKACLHVKRLQSGRWAIHSFIKEHNHEVLPNESNYFRGHRNLEAGSSNTDVLQGNRARRKSKLCMKSRQSGGCTIAKKQKVAVTEQVRKLKHLAIDEGDVQVMLDQFVCMQDENPDFFYSIDLNEKQCLRNVFWVDAKGRLDYANFADVVFLDTTYIKNEYRLPFAPFIGVNHHFQFVLIGCSLVADETKSTYAWLMRSWLRAMHKCPPKVILTVQDEALKEAIVEELPDSCHCYCLWDIYCKIPERLSHVMRRDENFMSMFDECVFKSWTIEQFEKRWQTIVDRFELSHDSWFKSLYADRSRWIPAYMKNIFLAGMSTRQRPEGINSFLDKYIQRRTPLREFLDQYSNLIRDKFEEERKADFETFHKQPALKSPSPFGKQMAALYTHTVFKKFQVEVLGVVACHPKKESEDGVIKVYRVQDFEESQDFLVEWNEATSDISCLCRTFEFNGYLCRHVMIVLQISGIHSIPSQYVLTRWTRDAKSRQKTKKQLNVELRVQRYIDLCQQAFRLSDEGSLSHESYNVAFNALEEALRKCESLSGSIQPSTVVHSSHESEEVNQGKNTNNVNKKNTTTNIRRQGQSNSQTLALHCADEQEGLQEGQLNSITSISDTRFQAQRMQGVGQLNFRSNFVSNRFDLQVGPRDTEPSSAGSMEVRGI